MRETVTIQTGQCGNQVGYEFWRQVCIEEGVSPMGIATRPVSRTHFYESDSGRYVPRNLMIDFEPRVIEKIVNSEYGSIFNKGNIFRCEHQGGAGNNWAFGYSTCMRLENDLMDALDAELEGCDCFENVSIVHSIAGGTGSGVCSFLIEKIKERYPKKLVSTYSIFPNNEESSDVVVQPYNSILTLRRLSTTDLAVSFDNNALNRIVKNGLSIPASYDQTNVLIGNVMCSLTSLLRFPGYQFTTFREICAAVVPRPLLRFAAPSISPINDTQGEFTRKSSCIDVLKGLIAPSNHMVVCGRARRVYMSALAVLFGSYSCNELYSAMARLKERQAIMFSNTELTSYQITRGTYTTVRSKVSGLMLSNQDSFLSTFNLIEDQFDRLMKRGAFVETYKRELTDMDAMEEFTEARMRLTEICQEYEAG